MGTVAVPSDFDMADLIRRAGGDRNTSKYDPDTTTLDVPGIADATLVTTRDQMNARTARADTNDKTAKQRAARAAALQRHEDAVLAADAVYQAALPRITAAVTLADLDGIPI